MTASQTVRELSSRLKSGAFSIWGGAIVVAMLLAHTASATPVAIYDSINGSTSNGSVPSDNVNWLANQFKTDSATYDLNSVVLDFLAAPSGTSGTIIEVDIYSDASGNPDTILGTLANPGSFAAGSNTFTASGISLAAGSSFWVVLQGVDDGTVNWLTTGSVPSGVGSSTSTNRSTTGGASWVGISSGAPYMMLVYATATSTPVPEIDPASFGSALSLVLGSLTLLERRRRQG